MSRLASCSADRVEGFRALRPQRLVRIGLGGDVPGFGAGCVLFPRLGRRALLAGAGLGPRLGRLALFTASGLGRPPPAVAVVGLALVLGLAGPQPGEEPLDRVSRTFPPVVDGLDHRHLDLLDDGGTGRRVLHGDVEHRAGHLDRLSVGLLPGGLVGPGPGHVQRRLDVLDLGHDLGRRGLGRLPPGHLGRRRPCRVVGPGQVLEDGVNRVAHAAHGRRQLVTSRPELLDLQRHDPPAVGHVDQHPASGLLGLLHHLLALLDPPGHQRLGLGPRGLEEQTRLLLGLLVDGAVWRSRPRRCARPPPTPPAPAPRPPAAVRRARGRPPSPRPAGRSGPLPRGRCAAPGRSAGPTPWSAWTRR